MEHLYTIYMRHDLLQELLATLITRTLSCWLTRFTSLSIGFEGP